MAKARFERDGAVGIVTIADPPLNLVGPFPGLARARVARYLMAGIF